MRAGAGYPNGNVVGGLEFFSQWARCGFEIIWNACPAAPRSKLSSHWDVSQPAAFSTGAGAYIS
jgi:hypothetical protein